MAKIISSVFGELRGKLGGSVFARNQFGMYVRSHILPVNPNTIAQRRSRALFADAVQAYCSLSPTEKASWAEYARDPMRFNPLRFMNPGLYGGFHAFVSLYIAAARAAAVARPATGLPAHTQDLYQITRTAPLLGVDGSIMLQEGGFPLRLVSATVREDGRCEVSITVDGHPPGPLTLPAGKLMTQQGVPFGIGVWISTYVKNPRNRPARDEFVHVGNTYIPNFDAPAPFSAPLTISFTSPIDSSEYRYGLQPGNALRITVVQIGENGQLRKIGSVATAVQPV
jgi:hypothetical protein